MLTMIFSSGFSEKLFQIIPPMRYLKSFSKTFYNFKRDPVMEELQLQRLRHVVQYMQMVSTFFLTQLEALMEIYSPDNMMLICETKYLNQVICIFFKTR